MIQQVYDLIEKFSKLHVVPFFTWDQRSKETLAKNLTDLPYFITPQGNVFIGAASFADIQANRVCLQAHLDHPGGYLQYDHEGNYFFANIFGHGKANFTGQTMGIFTSEDLFPLVQMEVEHTDYNNNGGVSAFFKEQNPTLAKCLDQQKHIVHMNAIPKITDDILSNWSLDNMIHVALVIHLLKNCNLSHKFYGLLTINEEAGQTGIREFSHYLQEKNLFLINFDVTGDHNHDIPDFGIRQKQNGHDLDQYLTPALTDWLTERNLLVNLPKGGSETNFLISQGIPAVSIYLKIDNYHNSVGKKKYLPETVKLTVLDKYLMFLKEFFNQQEFETLLNSKVESDSSVALSLMPRQTFQYYLKDYTEDIRGIFQPLNSYEEYLHTGQSKLSAIYQKYQLSLQNISSDNFDKIRQLVLSLPTLPFQDEMVLRLAETVAAELELTFQVQPGFIKRNIPEIKILVVALANFNACNHSYPERVIAYSADKLNADELPRVIIHELTHYFTRIFWPELNLNPGMRKYYDEGLAVYLVGKILNIPLVKALNMTQEQIIAFHANEAMLRKQFSDFSKGNLCQIFRGKYHTYFKRKKIKDPFKIKKEPFDRYGYFLAALELEKTYGKGVVNARTFCE